MTIHVIVDECIIDHAEAGSCLSCPLARAISQAAGMAVWVGYQKAWYHIYHTDGVSVSTRMIELPHEAVAFRKAYDKAHALGGSQEDPAPIEFDLPHPDEWLS